MRLFIGLVLWCLLLVLCWPIALLLILTFPLLWLVALPLRVIGFTFAVVIQLIGTVILFPFRVLSIG